MSPSLETFKLPQTDIEKSRCWKLYRRVYSWGPHRLGPRRSMGSIDLAKVLYRYRIPRQNSHHLDIRKRKHMDKEGYSFWDCVVARLLEFERKRSSRQWWWQQGHTLERNPQGRVGKGWKCRGVKRQRAIRYIVWALIMLLFIYFFFFSLSLGVVVLGSCG